MGRMVSNESTTGFGRYRKREEMLDKRGRQGTVLVSYWCEQADSEDCS